jgi:hypothetical protein
MFCFNLLSAQKTYISFNANFITIYNSYIKYFQCGEYLRKYNIVALYGMSGAQLTLQKYICIRNKLTQRTKKVTQKKTQICIAYLNKIGHAVE